MSCNKCSTNPCCCIPKRGLTGPMGPAGIQGNPGPQGIPGVITVENGLFTLNAAGTAATVNGNPVVLGGTAASPILTISTTKQLKLWFGLTRYLPGGIGEFSDGRSDGVIQNSVANGGNPNNPDSLNAITVIDSITQVDGWTGLITAINANSYTITFTKVGLGVNITGYWHGLTS